MKIQSIFTAVLPNVQEIMKMKTKRILISLVTIIATSLVVVGFFFWQSRQPVRNGQVYVKVIDFGYKTVGSLVQNEEDVQFATFEDQYGNQYSWYRDLDVWERENPILNNSSHNDVFLLTVVDSQIAAAYSSDMMKTKWVNKFLSQPTFDQTSTVDNIVVNSDNIQATAHAACYSRTYDYTKDMQCRKIDLTLTDTDRRFFVVSSNGKFYIMIGHNIPLNRIILFIPLDVSTLDDVHFEVLNPTK